MNPHSRHPLHFRDGHLFLETGGALWLFDTGAPTSFSSEPELVLAGVEFRLASSYLGMTATTLSDFVSVECAGLMGTDVLGQFDFLLDLLNGTAEVSSENLEYDGQAISLDDFMGIPIVSARIRGVDHRMFFDTGAQTSYFQHDSLVEYPSAGEVADFYPGFGRFQTETYNVDIVLGEAEFAVRCGTLPELLGTTLMMAGTEGIIGNQVLSNRRSGYFPRRKLLIL